MQELKAPAGYEFTGEYRLAKYGEWVLQADGTALRVVCNTDNQYFILRKLESARERRARLMQQLFHEFYRRVNITDSATPWIERTELIFAENPDEVKG